ncbi:MAG: hypothetical protein JWP65_3718, partial [Ramlibacter sp.]|nr:hypothetical protein [Ramlibacter sp.]
MKTFTTLLLALFAAWPVQAQAQDVDVQVERQRIGAERAAADAAFEAREKACYGKFGVNDCLDAARRRRNEAVADLRRQEVALNDAERKRRAAERLQDIDARAAAQRQQQAAERRQRALVAQQEREARAVQKAGKRP